MASLLKKRIEKRDLKNGETHSSYYSIMYWISDHIFNLDENQKQKSNATPIWIKTNFLHWRGSVAVEFSFILCAWRRFSYASWMLHITCFLFNPPLPFQMPFWLDNINWTVCSFFLSLFFFIGHNIFICHVVTFINSLKKNATYTHSLRLFNKINELYF